MKVYKEESEDQIVRRILQGEKSLYKMIVQRFNPYLYKIGRTYNYNHEDTEDLMQDTFVDAFKNLEKFENRSSFKTWIIRIMLNNCYRKKMKFSFINEINSEINENSNPMFHSQSEDIQMVIQNKELNNIIEEALNKIPENYRIVFTLREMNKFNVTETADLLQTSESNVKVRLNRSKNLLRKEIEKKYSPEELFDYHAIYCDAMVKRVMKLI